MATRIPQVVETIDVMPTLLELIGAPAQPGLQGKSLLPLVRGDATGIQVAISESPFFGRRRAIATGNYRLLLTQRTDQTELYRFRSDPGEQINLVADQPSRAASLESAIENWQKMVEHTAAGQETSHELDSGTLDQLRTLGYLD